MEETGFNPEDLEAVANVYDQVRVLFKKKYPDADTVLAQAFEKTIAQVLSELASKKENSLHFRSDIFQAKHKLWNMCGDKICAYIKTLDAGASKVLVEIFSQQQKIYKESGVSEESTGESAVELENTKKELNEILAAAEVLEQTARTLREENARLK